MIELIVTKISEGLSPICEAEAPDRKTLKFSIAGLQEGYNTPQSSYRLKVGDTIYVDEDTVGVDGNGVINRFYLKPPADEMSRLIQALKNKFSKPRDYPLVGDYVIDENGKMARLTVNDGDGLVQFHAGSSFFVWWKTNRGDDVSVEQSGSCGFQESIESLVDTGRLEAATFWTFKNFEVRAHNGVQYDVKVKVWKFKPKPSRAQLARP